MDNCFRLGIYLYMMTHTVPQPKTLEQILETIISRIETLEEEAINSKKYFSRIVKLMNEVTYLIDTLLF